MAPMTTPESKAAPSPDRSWTYNTQYDVVRWADLLQQEGEATPRVNDIKNYVDYINNDMPEGYMALAYILQDPSDNTWLYQMNQEGGFDRFYEVSDMHQFIGDKVILYDNDVYLFHSEQGVAARPLERITMINTDESPRQKKYLEIKIESAKLRAKAAEQVLRLSQS